MMRIQQICLYDADDPLRVLQVEDLEDQFRFHIITQHGSKVVDIKKDDITILESFLRNRRKHIKDPHVH